MISVPSNNEVDRLHAYWRASNYLCAGMLYLRDNVLLRRPLEPAHIKPRILGHWGTCPGLSFTLTHLNRLIREHDLDLMFVCGPGHGAAAVLAHAYLDGHYSERYPECSQDEAGMTHLFRHFSAPHGIGSHCTPQLPGSIHEGGELGYSLSHAFGAAFDNPDLIVAAMVGDGEAETGALAASAIGRFLNPARDGAVLPILHLNGYKIANPALLARIPPAELQAFFEGHGYRPCFVAGDDPPAMHRKMARALGQCVAEIRAIQARARGGGGPARIRWPMIVLRTPKGWTGPRRFDGHAVENSWRSHRFRWPTLPGGRRNCRRWKPGCAPTSPRPCSTGGPAGGRAADAGPDRRAPRQRQPACRWRGIAASARPARAGRIQPAGRRARRRRVAHAGAGRLSAGRDARKSGPLPAVRPRRDRQQPPGGGL